MSPQKHNPENCHSKTGSPTVYIRPTYEQLELAVGRDEQGFFSESPMDAPTRSVMLLRPKVHETTPLDELQHQGDPEDCKLQGTRETYRFVNLDAAVNLGMQAAIGHQQANPKCDGQPEIVHSAEVRRGLGVSEKLACQKCGFQTGQTKLYGEIPHTGKGRRIATPNMALQVGLYNTSIATAGARRLLSAMDTTVPSKSGLQNLSTKCGEIITNENERDMGEKRGITKGIHELQGHERESAVAVEMDRQYNNPLRNARKKTLFVPATQTRDVVCENVTTKKFAVMYHQESKLCKKCESSKCTETGECSATRQASFNMGDEEAGGSRCAEKLMNCVEPLLVNRITTDGDGCLAKGFNSYMQTNQAGMETEHLLDPPHLNRSLCGAISRASFSPDMFPGVTQEEKSKIQNRFADDISHRAQAEAVALQKKFRSDSSKKKARTATMNAVQAIIQCYMGNHTVCKKWSSVCGGRKYKFPYMPAYAREKLKISPTDKMTVVTLLSKRLGYKALEQTMYETNTQKAESVNHAFGVTNPKGSLTFSRNGSSRDHSAIHLVNNGHGNSIMKKCQAAGCSITPGSPAAKALAEIDKAQKYHAKRAKGVAYRKRRAHLRSKRYASYFSKKTLYKRGQLDPEPDLAFNGLNKWYKVRDEHNYSKEIPSN